MILLSILFIEKHILYKAYINYIILYKAYVVDSTEWAIPLISGNS
jgi:hypothetical protein